VNKSATVSKGQSQCQVEEEPPGLATTCNMVVDEEEAEKMLLRFDHKPDYLKRKRHIKSPFWIKSFLINLILKPSPLTGIPRLWFILRFVRR